jgi:peptidoglycan/xylan/chitin deacetylase (PgdA/CDA1 family)
MRRLWPLLAILLAAPVALADEPEQAVHNSTWGSGKTIKGKEAVGYVAFTFDDGPDPETTPRILDTLEDHRVPATFFVVGRRFANKNSASRAGADILRDMARRGFTIGNHTSRHHRLDLENFETSRKSIHQNARDIEKLVGYQPRLFRPPFGATTARVRRLLSERNDTLVMWSIDPRDYRRQKKAELRERVTRQILEKGGGVVLLHDTKTWTAGALPGILKDLEEANCARLKAGKPLILPVSLHYFLRDPDGSPRPIPPETVNNTQANLDALTKRCQNGN